MFIKRINTRHPKVKIIDILRLRAARDGQGRNASP